MDYALIGFTQSCAELAFQGTDKVTLFTYTPPHAAVQGFCIVSLVGYPIVFVAFMSLAMLVMTKGGPAWMYPDKPKTPDPAPTDQPDADDSFEMEEAKKMLVWNNKFQKWTDPISYDMKINIDPVIPAWIPVLPNIMRTHVRACIPVVDHEEGETLNFKYLERKALKTRAELRQERNEELDNVRKAIEKVEAEFEREVQKMSDSTGGSSIAKEKKKKKLEAERLRKENQLKRQEKLNDYRKKQLQAYDQMLSDHDFPSPPWVPTEDVDDGDCVAVKSMFKQIEEFKSIKSRDENTKLDPEEAFAMRQFIEQRINAEKRLLKYNIVQVEFKNGYLVPKEPLKNGEFWLPEEDYLPYLDQPES
jgi:hypothetical protein